ncbi:MAG: DUF1566 domain-containing protein [Actinobacteria bacterium]|nr:DUF1566 domain-containing protein [Actinomycetota bacterium]
MTQTIKKASIITMVAIFIATMCLSVLILPSKTYADTVPYEIGDTGPAGGIIFWVDGLYCLEVTPINLSDNSPWSNITDALAGASGVVIGTGQANTTTIINQSGHTTSAAKICDDFSLNGYDDWFLPSSDELVNIWSRLHLQGLGNFNNEYYWSSTETSSSTATVVKFSGWGGSSSKSEAYQVRAIRAFEGMKEVIDSEPEEPIVWVRTMPMTCWQVFINEDNMFEFIFWYPYKDNNWVQIFDIEGNMVYEVDIPLKDPHIIVDLPDGMYNVKTFRFDPEDPIQEFLIGKP